MTSVSPIFATSNMLFIPVYPTYILDLEGIDYAGMHTNFVDKLYIHHTCTLSTIALPPFVNRMDFMPKFESIFLSQTGFKAKQKLVFGDKEPLPVTSYAWPSVGIGLRGFL